MSTTRRLELAEWKPLPWNHERVKWVQIDASTWMSTGIPDGDCCCARVTASSLNEDGTRSYFAYRNARAVAVTRDLDEAKTRAEDGVPVDKTAILNYVGGNPGEIPPFLRLTDEERRAVRATYPHAAPSESRLRMAGAGGVPPRRSGGAGDPADPGTARLLAERAEAERPARAAAAPTVRGGKRAVLGDPEARLALTGAWDNPGKPGTKRHDGYKIILDSAGAGLTVRETLAAGADPLRLGKCLARGLVELKS